MRHCLFNLLAALSVALFVAVGVLLLRSFYAEDLLLWSSYDPASARARLFTVTCNRGEINMGYGKHQYGQGRRGFYDCPIGCTERNALVGDASHADAAASGGERRY
jgi:hypothetical protein